MAAKLLVPWLHMATNIQNVDFDVYFKQENGTTHEKQMNIDAEDTLILYISVKNKGILIQQDITTTVIDDKLPRERENLSINVPTIEEEKPEEIYVLLNGEKLDQSNINYDQENNLLQIQNISLITTDNQTNWGNSENNYQIIYIYPSKIGEENRTIEMNTTVNTKLFTKDEIQKQDLQNVEITKTGNIVDIQKIF